MASHNLEQQPEERLFTRIGELENQLREMRTLQQQGASALPFAGHPGVGQDYLTTLTIPANSQGYFSLSLRTSSLGPTIWEPALAIHVDTDNVNYLWRTGSALTAGQRRPFASVVRNWEYGLTPQDPENIGSWDIQIWNLDTASHTYYIHVRLFGSSTLAPLTVI